MDDDDYGFDDMDALIDQDDGGGDVDEEEMMMMMDDEDDGGGGDAVGATQRGVGSAQMDEDAARARTQTQTQGGGIDEDDLDFLANAGATQRPGGDASTGANAAANDAAFPDDDDDAAAMDDEEEEDGLRPRVRLLPIRPRSRGERRSLRTFPIRPFPSFARCAPPHVLTRGRVVHQYRSRMTDTWIPSTNHHRTGTRGISSRSRERRDRRGTSSASLRFRSSSRTWRCRTRVTKG